MTQESPSPRVPPRLKDHSPATKFIYAMLVEFEPSTQRQLHEQTQLPRRTVREALRRLCDADEVTETGRVSGDARKKWYETTRSE